MSGATEDGRPATTVELDPVPPLRASLATGLARSAASAARRDRTVRPDAMPPVELAAHGLATDPARLSAYQHLVGETATDELPAGFVHVLAFPVATALMVRGDFPLPLLGMVHLANEVTQHRPVLLGEVVDVVAHARALTAHHRGVSVQVVVRASVGGEPVWQGISTYLAKGFRLAGAQRPERPDRPEWTAPTPTGAWRLPASVGPEYAAVSGDHNPIHTSSLAARAFGFPRTIAHGMYTAARALAEVRHGPAFTWRADFAAPITLPGTVSVAVRAADGPGGTVEVWGRRLNLRVSVQQRR